MPKISKSRKSQKTIKRRRNKSTKRRMRGGCGCNSAAPAVIMHNDNRLLEANLSSRILGGGRKTKRGRKDKQHNKKSGGSALSQLGSLFSANSVITAQPIANVPNVYSPPLV